MATVQAERPKKVSAIIRRVVKENGGPFHDHNPDTLASRYYEIDKLLRTPIPMGAAGRLACDAHVPKGHKK
jgi:hypothetical protein